MLGIYEVLVKGGDNQLGLAGTNGKLLKGCAIYLAVTKPPTPKSKRFVDSAGF